MLVPIDRDRRPLRAGRRRRDDLFPEASVGHRALRFALAEVGEAVLVLARDLPALGDVLRGLAERHRVAVGDEVGMGEAPPERAVRDLRRPARELALGLEHHDGRARHALDPARDEQVALPAPDRLRRTVERLQARAAEAAYGLPPHPPGETP